MTPSEIITSNITDADPNQVLQGLLQAIKAKKAIILQEGNTVLTVFNIGNGNAEVHLFTKDSPIKLAKAVLYFVKKLKETGVQKVYGIEPPTQILQLLKNLGIEIQDSDNPKFKWMAQV
jgi:hypothetical protein